MARISAVAEQPTTPIPAPAPETLASSRIYIGVEIELEGGSGRLCPEIATSWALVNDNSLRNNGFELIFDGPKAGQDILDAVNSLYTNWNANWVASQRCSTHVHLDMGDTHHGQVGWVYLMGVCLEDYLFSLGGSEYRQDSVFCRNPKGNVGQMQQMIQNIRHGEYHNLEEYSPQALLSGSGMMSMGADLKYSSVNVNSIPRFGTIEFRHWAPITHREDLLLIINTLMKLKIAALSEDPVEKFCEFFNELSPSACTSLKKFGAML